MMQRFTRRMLSVTMVAVIAVLAAGTAVVTASSAPPVEEPFVRPYDAGSQPESNPLASFASTSCRKTFTSGTGIAAFNWCFSDNGNVVQIENSAGMEHVNNGSIIEGFCVAANGEKKGQSDAQNASTGLEVPTYPGPAKVVHKTLDGDIKITQRFVQQKANRQINILMNIENTSDEALQNVYVARFIDVDFNNTTGDDDFYQATRSVWAQTPGDGHLDLFPQSTQYPANSMVFDTFDAGGQLDESCYNADADARPTFSGDGAMGVMAQLGTILPGETKQVKFLYRVSI